MAGADGDVDASTSEADASPSDAGLHERRKQAQVGPNGGTIELDGLRLDIPAGSLLSEETIIVTRTSAPAPAGYEAYSPVYHFEPDGLTFVHPVSVSVPFSGDQRLAALFWSRTTSAGYDRLGGSVASGVVTEFVGHFSSGFVANGAQYVDPPDRTCVVTKPLELRTFAPSGVAVFFTVDDCQGRPITGLVQTSTHADFVVEEDGQPVSAEAASTIIPRPGLQVFASLVLDMSSSTQRQLTQVIDGARAFVEELQVRQGLPVQISVELFAGDATLTEWQAPTLDSDAVLAKLDSLATYAPGDPSSTNLYGAVVDSLSRSADAQSAFKARNLGGAFTSGYVVLFTDGRDTSALRTKQQALTSLSHSADSLLAVGLLTADYDRLTLEQLAPNAVITTPYVASLRREFLTLANRIAGQVRRTYLLGYCSPKRNGQHMLSLGISGATMQEAGTVAFSSTGFGPGCAPSMFVDVCNQKECGGLGCGACDDRVAACEPAGLTCRPFCLDAGPCGGEIMNPRGYSEMCPADPGYYECQGMCIDTSQDLTNCGACGNMCAIGASCLQSNCVCPGGSTVCQNRCVHTDADPMNCAGCGRICLAACSSGTCQTPRAVDLGRQQGCSLLSDGTVRCWDPGQRPIDQGLSGAIAVSAGATHGCALLSTGAVDCWGQNRGGEVGDGTTTERRSPVPVVGISTAVQIATSLSSPWTCAALADGSIQCWGSMPLSQQSHIPINVPGIAAAAQVSIGYNFGCARIRDGTVQCWGNNLHGQLGDGTRTSHAPAPVPGLANVTDISVGHQHVCALRADGSVLCWGADNPPFGAPTDSTTPVQVTGLSNVVGISAGATYSCAVLADRTLWCWGSNYGYQLGDGTNIDRPLPTAVPGVLADSVATGEGATCAITGGTSQCWGQQSQAGSRTPVAMRW